MAGGVSRKGPGCKWIFPCTISWSKVCLFVVGSDTEEIASPSPGIPQGWAVLFSINGRMPSKNFLVAFKPPLTDSVIPFITSAG